MARQIRAAALAALAGIFGTAGAAELATTVFDFEAVVATNHGAALILSSPQIDLTITRIGGGSIGIWSTAGFGLGFPPGWGSKAMFPLEMGPFAAVDGGPFRLSFSQPILSISVQSGDFAPSDADSFELEAGGRSAVAWQSGSTGFPAFQRLALSGIQTTVVVLSGGSKCMELSIECYPQSVFWDNITVTSVALPPPPPPVPEPAAAALLAAGLLLTSLQARRRRSG